MMLEVTCTAPVNIAVIKYWGKRNVPLMLPTNGSLSVTLSQDALFTKTSIRLDEQFTSTRFWLNGIEEINLHPKLILVISTFKSILQSKLEKEKEKEKENENENNINPSSSSSSHLSLLSAYHQSHHHHLHIVSENNFPTAAGLASSASGYAALVYALAHLYGLTDILSIETLSTIARLGSGSACRSLLGGFVVWEMGTLENGEDSFATCVAPSAHWPDLHAIVCVVQETKKTVPSSVGMQASVATSPLHAFRCTHVVPNRLQSMAAAIRDRDFATFARLTMMDSNQFHAVCLDTFPPILYLNDTSKRLIQLVSDFNAAAAWSVPVTSPQRTSSSVPPPPPPLGSKEEEEANAVKAAYTFDAGPNAVVFVLAHHVAALLALLTHYFPPPATTPLETFLSSSNAACAGPAAFASWSPADRAAVVASVTTQVTVQPPGAVKRILHLTVGDGPRVVAVGPSEVSLINKNGFPHRIRD